MTASSARRGFATRHPGRVLVSLLSLALILLIPALMASGRSGDAARVIEPPAGSVTTKPLSLTTSGSPGRATWTAWPQALHDARHSGSAVVTGPRRGEVEWQRHLSDGAVPGGPVIGADGTIYVVDSDGELHAVRPEDGSDVWHVDTGVPVGGDLSTSPLVLPDGDVVAATDGGLGAWSAAGAPRWRVPIRGGLTSPATLDGSRLYVGTRSGSVAAIDVADHHASLAWELDLDVGQSYGSVVVSGAGRIYQTSPEGLLAIDDAGDHGAIAWRGYPDDGLVEVSPGLAPDGTVLLGTNGAREWGYDPAGTLLWSTPRNITYSSPSVTEDGLAFVGEHNDRVHVLDASSGRELGLFPTTVTKVDGKTRVWTSVVVDAQHAFYFGTRTHYLVGVQPDGRRLFTLDLGSSTSSYPALTADHRLVIGTDGGDLVSVS